MKTIEYEAAFVVIPGERSSDVKVPLKAIFLAEARHW